MGVTFWTIIDVLRDLNFLIVVNRHTRHNEIRGQQKAGSRDSIIFRISVLQLVVKGLSVTVRQCGRAFFRPPAKENVPVS